VDDAALQELASIHNVFARVDPQQKARLVRAVAAAGHVVGFLGDGVNDAPALKVADVGISVDSGTDIAKDAADIVLLEKSLGVLTNGIQEGRKTFGNITKYIFNTVSANFGNMATVAVSSLALNFIPLLPSQILLNNLLSDLPLVAISTDRVDADLLQKPRRWNLRTISRFMVYFGLLSAVFDVILIVGLLVFFHTSAGLFRTAWFVESAGSEIIVTFAIRTRKAFWRSKPSALLLTASIAAVGVTALLPLTAVGASYFQFQSMPAPISWFVVAVLLSYFLAAEVAKRWFFRREGELPLKV
jgi:Mg2+-importing ATPase